MGLGACGIEYVSKPAPPPPPAGPEVTNVLFELIEQQEHFEIIAEDFSSTSLEQIITLGTPAGYRLNIRYTELGVSLVEALKRSRDTQLINRLFDLAQFSTKDKVRAEALVTLGSFSDPKDYQFFKTALLDKELSIRFAAVEALQLWGLVKGRALLTETLGYNWSPLLQVFAAQALLSQGDQSGLPVLFKRLKDNSWIVRAMAARYLGDFADPKDYRILLSALETESRNDFVSAELAISALKLLSKNHSAVQYSPATQGWKENKEVAYSLTQDGVIEVEPLVLIPPRLYIPETERVSQVINNRLLFLIRERLDKPLRPIDEQDPNLETLNKLITPAGFALQTRYSNLNILVAEGLGGTSDLLLRQELVNLAQKNKNPLVRANALLSLAYNARDEDIILITEALNEEDPIVRFGAMEAIQVGRIKEALPSLTNLAYREPIPAFRVFAIGILLGFGDETAHQLLISNLNDRDWPARAMRFWYLGRYGKRDDFLTVRSHLNTESNPFVRAEIALATTRLLPFED